MSNLADLYDVHGQSPWLDNLRRDWLSDGTLAARVAEGVRGLTSNPSIFQKAITGSDAYDAQFRDLMVSGRNVEDAYWDMVVDDIAAAAAILAPVHESSGGADGHVSIEVDPSLANDTASTLMAAQDLRRRLDASNVLIKIPGTAAGLPAIRQAVQAGINVNVTLLFSVERYGQVIDAYMDGLDGRGPDADLSDAVGVASFFISRVDTEVDRRLEAIGTPDALALRGKAAVAQAKIAYQLFKDRFASERWADLASRGARVQRPLWASTSTKNPDYPDTLYVDELIGPDTVNTLPDATLDAFADHGTLARTVDNELDQAHRLIDAIAAVGVDLDDVADTLEDEGVAAFRKAFDELIEALADKARALR